MEILILKAVHLIAMVCWFAGLFYSVRLFIYHVEAADRPDAERQLLASQFIIMERRLWNGITTPSAVITAIAGIRLMMVTGAYSQPWFHFKMLLLVFLFAYHLHCGIIRKQLLQSKYHGSSAGLRMYNEVATILLCGSIFIAVTRSYTITLSALGILVLILALVFGLVRIMRGKKTTRP